MTADAVQPTLHRLRTAADRARSGWAGGDWTFHDDEGPGHAALRSQMLKGVRLKPGTTVTLQTDLDLPELIADVPVEGDALELTVMSLYPMDLEVAGRQVLAEPGAPAALGPALIELVDKVVPGGNGTLTMTVRVAQNQVWEFGIQLQFTTPRLRARFEVLDTAWAQLVLAQALACGAEDEAALDRAAAAVADPLPTGDEQELLRQLDDLSAALERFHDRAAALRVHLVGHSHIDMSWLWTWPDTQAVLRRDAASVLDLMQEFPELTFTHSQPAGYETIRTTAPELWDRLVTLVDEGRWEPATLTWVEADTNLASGEALARHFLESVRWSREHLGASPTSMLAPDNFGHAGSLPQLAVSAGAQRYYHHRAAPGGTDPWPAYWWQGIDGTRLLAVTSPGYSGVITAGALAHAALRGMRFGHPATLSFHGIGDHGGGPARQDLQALQRLRAKRVLPTAACSTLQAYTDDLLAAGVSLPVHSGESSLLFEGCYTSHGDAKHANRHGESLLTCADTLAALAGLDRREQLRPAWRKLLFHQFHDILCGASVAEVYREAEHSHDQVVAAGEQVREQALRVLHADVAAGRIAVTNTLGWERRDIVTVPLPADLRDVPSVQAAGSDGSILPVQCSDGTAVFVACIPAFSTRSFNLEPASEEQTRLTVTAAYGPYGGGPDPRLDDGDAGPPYLRVETPSFRCYVRRDNGILTSLLDKRVDRELVGFGMRRGSDYTDAARVDLGLGVFQLVEEAPHSMSAWHLDEVRRETSLISGAVVEVTEVGPVRAVISVRHTINDSTIDARLTFYRDLDRIDVTADVDWQEVGSAEVGVPNLKVSYAARLDQPQAWYEIPFGAVSRPTDGQEVPAYRWADVGEADYGMALLSPEKSGFDALGGRLRLSLLRSSYGPDTQADIGRHSLRWSLLPHPGGWAEAGVVQAAAGAETPLLARHVPPTPREHGAARPAVPQLQGDPSVVVASLKRSYDGAQLVLRAYESAGRRARVRLTGLPADARVTEVSVTEDELRRLPVTDGEMDLEFGPFAVRTFAFR